jgi:magnesium transporter
MGNGTHSHHNHRHAETALRHMVTRVPRARAEQTCGQLLAALHGQHFDLAHTVCVLDAEEVLIGIAQLTDVLAAAADKPLYALMQTRPITVPPEMDQEKVASLAVRHHLRAVPVVDRAGHLLGVFPPEALIDVLRREHVEDMHRLAGIRREQDHARDAIEAPPVRRARDRLPWLLVGLFGSIIATWVVSRFEQALQARVQIAFFVPGIVYLADAIGTQTEAIAVRGLSLSHQSVGRLIAGELRTGLLIGIILGGLALPGIWWIFDDLNLAISVSVALLAAGGAATSIGLFFPWILARLGKDPAFGSGPVATIVQDVLSLLIYFVIVSLLLF